MKKAIIVGLISILFLVSGVVYSTDIGPRSGNGLYAFLTSEETWQNGAAMSYIMGVSDTIGGLQESGMVPHTFKIPSSVTVQQQADVVKLYLIKHPEMRHYQSWFLIASALKEAFPKNDAKKE